jgi:hypothetical protein
MVNSGPGVELAGQARGGVAILDAQLAAGPVAVGVDGSLRHAELARDLLRRQMLVDQAQAFALAWGEQPHRIIGYDISRGHDASS